MAEIQMKDYEEIRRDNDDHQYDDLKIDKKKVQIDHVVVPSWKKWIKRNCLALTIYMLSTGLILTVVYFTVIAHLRQKLADIDMKLSAFENRTKQRESEHRESTDLAQLRQKLSDIDMRLIAIEKQNGTKQQESENKESTNLDTRTMCYNGGVWQKYDEKNICVCTAGFLGKQCEYSDTSEEIKKQE